MRKKVIFLLVGIFAITLLSVIGIKSFNNENIKQKEVPNEEKINKKENKEKTDIITNESNQE